MDGFVGLYYRRDNLSITGQPGQARHAIHIPAGWDWP